jgi:putative hydrolase of the HAD superfamily
MLLFYQMNPNIKVILFDFYGTLLVFDDFDQANAEWEASFAGTAKRFDLSHTAVQSICKKILECGVEKDSSGKLTTYETKIKNAFEKYGAAFTDEELKQIADESVERWQKYIRPADDVLEVLRILSLEKKIGLITNFDHSPHVRKVLASSSLNNYFELILISDEAGYEKPDRKIFQRAIEHFGIKPEEAIYVGDNIVDDVLGSHQAGLNPVFINRNSKSHEHENQNSQAIISQLPDLPVIKSLSELISL